MTISKISDSVLREYKDQERWRSALYRPCLWKKFRKGNDFPAWIPHFTSSCQAFGPEPDVSPLGELNSKKCETDRQIEVMKGTVDIYTTRRKRIDDWQIPKMRPSEFPSLVWMMMGWRAMKKKQRRKPRPRSGASHGPLNSVSWRRNFPENVVQKNIPYIFPH